MLTEVRSGEISDQLEANVDEKPSPSMGTHAFDGDHTLNVSQAGSMEKGAVLGDESPRSSSSLDAARIPPSSGTWKHRLLGSRYLKCLPSAAPDRPRPWIATFIRFGPISGLSCLLLALGSIVASLGILVGSDHQPVESWSVAPSTYLAVFTAIGNLSVRYAAYQGVIVAWWYRASRGSKLRTLHEDWRSGMSLRGALTSGRNIGLLGLACVFSTVVVIDGPLLQRSSSVMNSGVLRSTLLDVTLVPELPTGFSGDWDIGAPANVTNGGTFNSTWPTVNGSWVGNVGTVSAWNMFLVDQLWSDQVPLEGSVRGCPANSQCTAKIKAPALFPTACRSESITSNFYAPFDPQLQSNFTMAPPLSNDYFIIDINLLPEERETINLITAYWTGNSNCEGLLNFTICTLESGIGEYDFVIKNDKATIDLDSARRPRFVSLANNTAVIRKYPNSTSTNPSTLAGVVQFLGATYGTIGFYTPIGDGPKLQNTFTGWTTPTKWIDFDKVEKIQCPPFLDPLDDVLQSANLLMIYSGYLASKKITAEELRTKIDPDLEVNSTVAGTINEQNAVFHTNYWYFLGAAIIEVVCVLIIAPTYWGWWRFGRPISFSPVEMAKAFGAPMLADYDSNASGDDLAQAVGNQRVRYGVVTSGQNNETRNLAFAPLALVDEPQQGAHYYPHS